MLRITVTPQAVLLAALVGLAGVFVFYASDALGSDPDHILQGDTNCDDVIDTQDVLNDLRYIADLTVGPFGGCPQIGTVAAIPGPEGPQGPQGPQGPAGPPGTMLFAGVDSTGVLKNGTAISVDTEVGDSGIFYKVTFGSDVSECAAVAANGAAAGPGGSGGFSLNAVPHTVFTGFPDDSTVAVAFRDVDSGDFVETGFHLIVAC